MICGSLCPSEEIQTQLVTIYREKFFRKSKLKNNLILRIINVSEESIELERLRNLSSNREKLKALWAQTATDLRVCRISSAEHRIFDPVVIHRAVQSHSSLPSLSFSFLLVVFACSEPLSFSLFPSHSFSLQQGVLPAPSPLLFLG